jgi:hypothetical protein
MTKLKVGLETFEIDCHDDMCGNCRFRPQSGQKCTLFNVLLDRVIGSSLSDAGWIRPPECINATTAN